MFLLGQLRDEISVPLRFLWAAMFTIPTLAIQPMKLLQTSVADPDDAPDAAMGISSEGLKRNGYACVAIILYFVKRRKPLRRCAPQIAARCARAAGDSVPGPLTTFTLGDQRFALRVHTA
jgi:hypothetical protein